MSTTILWLRRDLRLTDNPALDAASRAGRMLPVYIHDSPADEGWPPGAASNWWLHHSLAALDGALRRLGSGLVLRTGAVPAVLAELAGRSGASRIVWNRCYEPGLAEADRKLESKLRSAGLDVRTFNASLLFEPREILRDTGPAGSPYRVFTAYWRACLRAGLPGVRYGCPERLPGLPPDIAGVSLETLGLLPRVRWYAGLEAHWQPGEAGALARLGRFLEQAVRDYAVMRERPAVIGTSALSPHLHFGEIGPRQVVQAARDRLERAGEASVEAFVREIGWREFAHHLLFHFPRSDREPLNPRFARFPWRKDYAGDLAAWQQGRTGIPLVDAGMRQLWHTGWMHNRVRMVVASFLTKNLLIPWQAGAAWFWDTLVDADLAGNTLGWQWVAGCGADAAPWFRIFNPVLQGEKFDPGGAYVRRWVPELARLPARFIHRPWAAPAGLRADCADYPPPIVDLKASRERALAAYHGS